MEGCRDRRLSPACFLLFSHGNTNDVEGYRRLTHWLTLTSWLCNPPLNGWCFCKSLYRCNSCGLFDLRFFERNSYTVTRSHDYKVLVPFARSDVRNSSYAVRAAKACNELPADAVDFCCTKHFTNSLLKIDISKYCAALQFQTN
jgi:hypothetical protein